MQRAEDGELTKEWRGPRVSEAAGRDEEGTWSLQECPLL